MLFLAMQFITNSKLFATNYYVNPSSTSTLSDGSYASPWKTIDQVNDSTKTFNAGDTIFFKRGELYNGQLQIKGIGSPTKPIVYMPYGEGDFPEFTHTATGVIVLKDAQFIQINGLKITDKTMDATNHTITAKIAYGIVLVNSPNCTISNCDISLVGVGIAPREGSNNTTIQHNYIHNLRIIINTVGGIDDYGATAIVIGSSSNQITNNFIEGCWAKSFDFLYDGGVVEFFGKEMNNNLIKNNTAVDCNGFAEFGSDVNGYATNNLIVYNKIINCGATGNFHNNNGLNVHANNTRFFNNVIIETKKQFSPADELFWYANPSQVDSIQLKNNIFWLTSGINFVRNNIDTSKMNHTNNIFLIRSGDIHITLHSTELLSTNSSIFIDTLGNNPISWNYNLSASSPAINFGTTVGQTNDFIGNSMNGLPDAGILEKQPPPPPLNLTATIDSISCFGDSATVTINVTNGKPPYIGLGKFKKSFGSFEFSAKDSVGTEGIILVTITQPPKLLLNTSSGIVTNLFDTTHIVASAIGGTAPYTYQLNSNGFQNSTIFQGIVSNKYTISVKDIKGCTTTSSIDVKISPNTPIINGKILLHIYPNPSSAYYTLAPIQILGQPVLIQIRIYNAVGVMVYSTKGFTNIPYTFGSNFPTGNYTLVAELGGAVQTIQLIKL